MRKRKFQPHLRTSIASINKRNIPRNACDVSAHRPRLGDTLNWHSQSSRLYKCSVPSSGAPQTTCSDYIIIMQPSLWDVYVLGPGVCAVEPCDMSETDRIGNVTDHHDPAAESLASLRAWIIRQPRLQSRDVHSWCMDCLEPRLSDISRKHLTWKRLAVTFYARALHAASCRQHLHALHPAALPVRCGLAHCAVLRSAMLRVALRALLRAAVGGRYPSISCVALRSIPTLC